MKHYIAMVSSGGNTLADNCEVYKTHIEAIESLAESWDLDKDEVDELSKENKFVHHDYDHAHLLEIEECFCAEPHIHSDSTSPNPDSIAEFYCEFDPLIVDGKYKQVITVDTLNYYPEFAFNVDSQDVESVKDYLGKSAQDYDSFFVYAENGDYVAVYGMSGIIPYNEKSLDLIYPVYPTWQHNISNFFASLAAYASKES